MPTPECLETGLPIFDPAERLHVGTGSYREAANTGAEDFLRYVHTVGPGEQTIRERLDITSEELRKISEMCGATLVPHTLGLYPIEDYRYHHLDDIKTPPGYTLAARVDAITSNTQWYSPRPAQIYYGIHRYRSNNGQLCDMRSTQFIKGRRAADPDEEPRWFLVDIEPRLYSPDQYQYMRI